jgi:hypothetical protein
MLATARVQSPPGTDCSLIPSRYIHFGRVLPRGLRAMIAESPSPENLDPSCWQCGAPANPAHAYKLLLFAASHLDLDPLGFPVERKANLDEVTVAVPRCRLCRERNWFSVIVLLGSAILGAIIVTLLRNMLCPNAAPPRWLHVHQGIGDLSTGIGLVGGFFIGLSAIVLQARASGLRSFGSYPPLSALRQLGWQHVE